MWILTRNNYDVLRNDGKWSYESDDWRIFATFALARAYAEAEGVEAFTRAVPLEERVKDEMKCNDEEAARINDYEYVALPESLEFQATKETVFTPDFQSFVVSHYAVSGGAVVGVLGWVNDNGTLSPFYSFVGDDYFAEFCSSYRRTEGTVSRKDEGTSRQQTFKSSE
ncbi:MAG: hypothetical protein NXI28_12460 [bacterium]|nr:hypothetical protein [bacterium]